MGVGFPTLFPQDFNRFSTAKIWPKPLWEKAFQKVFHRGAGSRFLLFLWKKIYTKYLTQPFPNLI